MTDGRGGGAGVRRTARVCALGFALLQLAWVLALPPFRGIDEFDHAYRAAAVARGQWVAEPAEATRGTGAVMHVPADIVEAAAAQCWALDYTSADDCRASSELPDGLVTVGSAAGRYNPFFYAAVGAPAMLFTGTTALYAMRLASVVLCSVFFGLAVWSTRRWARTPLPLAALFVATTPMVVYSGAVAAPNGLEMTAALALWCSLLGVALHDRPRGRELTGLWCVAAAAGAVLVTLRSLGPLWLGLIVLTVLLVAPDRGWCWSALRSRAGVRATVVVAAATAASLAWILAMRSLRLSVEPGVDPVGLAERSVRALQALPLWVFQTIAAFPTRGEQAPAVVYACVLVVGGALVMAALPALRGRLALALLVVAVVAAAIPLTLTVLTYADFGVAWQGRYGLPYSVGLLLLVGLALDRRPLWAPAMRVLLLVGAVAWSLAHVMGTLNVQLTETASSAPAVAATWWSVPAAALLVLLVTGAALVWLPVVRTDRRPAPHVPVAVGSAAARTTVGAAP